MFKNIGGKIKGLAVIFTVIGIIISVIFSIIYFVSHIILFGVLILVGGIIASWIGSFILYGFGELIENSSIIADKLSGNNNVHSNINFANNIPMPNYEEIVENSKNASKQNNYESIEDVNNSNDESKSALTSSDVNINIGSERTIKFSCPKCLANISTQLNKLVTHKIVICPACKERINSKDILDKMTQD